MAFGQVEMMAALVKYETSLLDRIPLVYYIAQKLRVEVAEQLLQEAIQKSPNNNRVVTKDSIELWKHQEDMEQAKMG